MRSTLQGVALLFGAALVLLALGLAYGEVARFNDPCFAYNADGDGDGVVRASPSEACPAVGGTSETKTEALLRLAFINGLGALAGVCAIVGALRSRSAFLAAASGLLLILTLPLLLGFGWFLTLGASLVFLAAARDVQVMDNRDRVGRAVTRAVGFTGAFLLALLIGSTAYGLFTHGATPGGYLVVVLLQAGLLGLFPTLSWMPWAPPPHRPGDS
ncbi:MAG TPA: hypothetical protein VNZ52_04050 [Candidatus Thermoplasmatota archaeon]|nr:hypothetical protein [Candidatus Thermoplasmatota archaeon]